MDKTSRANSLARALFDLSLIQEETFFARIIGSPDKNLEIKEKQNDQSS